MQSLHLADDRPHMFEDRWIVLDTVPALTDADLTQISPNEWLLREAPYTHGTIELAAACAGDAGGHLGKDPQTPALSLLRITWMHETAITYVTQIFAPDYRLSLDL